VQSEIAFSGRKDDFIILTDEQKSPLHGFVEDMVYKYGTSHFQVKFSPARITRRELTLYFNRTGWQNSLVLAAIAMSVFIPERRLISSSE
jgi:hypothetical protein